MDWKSLVIALMLAAMVCYYDGEWRGMLTASPLGSEQIIYLAGYFLGSFALLFVAITLVRKFLQK